MKNKVISIRVTEEEFNKVNNFVEVYNKDHNTSIIFSYILKNIIISYASKYMVKKG